MAERAVELFIESIGRFADQVDDIGDDLAEGLGEPTELEPETASFLLPTMEAQADLIRSSGMFGGSVPVDDDADDATKLLALLGRDPR